MKNYSKILTKEYLENEYFVNKRSGKTIAKILGCNNTTVYRSMIKRGIVLRNPHGNKKLIGSRFGRLLVIDRSNGIKYKSGTRQRWKCLCDCGKTLIVDASNLRGGTSKSCGCLKNELTSKRCYKGGNYLSGWEFNSIKHVQKSEI